MNTIEWDRRFLTLARFWADMCSKDPSTKVGAVIVDRRRVVIGMGYNGFPRGVTDRRERLHDRAQKLLLMVHAEVNAILNAHASPIGATLYSTLMTCHDCAKYVIQAGVDRVVCPVPADMHRWEVSFASALEMYHEAGVAVNFCEAERGAA